MLGRVRVTLRACIEPVLRESDGNVLALVDVRIAETNQMVHAEVFDPRLEPGEGGYDDG